MSQNAMHYAWTRDEVDKRLQIIMKDIHESCVNAAAEYGTPEDYINGANIAGFIRVADAMISQGI
jgi:glutamate dehydrogenase (NADP+)